MEPRNTVVVVIGITSLRAREGKPTGCLTRKAAVLWTLYGDVLRTPPGSKSGACTHRGDSGTWESLLSPCHTGPEDQGYRLTKSPGAEEVASASQRVRLGAETQT
jgi:hypothetical protein